MIRWVIGCALVAGLFALPSARADDEFDELKKAYDDAQQNWWTKVEESQDPDQPKDAPLKLDESKLPPRPEKEFVPRFRAYADKHAGKSEAIPALRWLIDNAGRDLAGDLPDPEKTRTSDAVRAIEQLRQHHAADPALFEHMRGIAQAAWQVGRAPLIPLLEAIIEKNPNPEAKASAMYNLAQMLYEQMGAAPGDAAGDASPTADQDKKRGEQLFRQLARDYPDTRAGKRGAGHIFEIEHLQIGMKPPDLVGTDPDDKELRLSQFRGKVVVAYFWGFW